MFSELPLSKQPRRESSAYMGATVMAFEELIARINLFLSDVENEPEDAHEILEQLHLELNQLRATGQPIPEDLARLEKQLEQEFSERTRTTEKPSN
jgi:F0F1-type ATP synthase membrane subunit b/b'